MADLTLPKKREKRKRKGEVNKGELELLLYWRLVLVFRSTWRQFDWVLFLSRTGRTRDFYIMEWQHLTLLLADFISQINKDFLFFEQFQETPCEKETLLFQHLFWNSNSSLMCKVFTCVGLSCRRLD